MQLYFFNGYSKNKLPTIENVGLLKKCLSKELEKMSDVYIVDKCFNWTYVHTHESTCGPYFCKID